MYMYGVELVVNLFVHALEESFMGGQISIIREWKWTFQSSMCTCLL